MGLYKNSKDASNTLVPIAGRGKAEYGASTVRKGGIDGNSQTIEPDGYLSQRITFAEPMPDANYEVILNVTSTFLNVQIIDKKAGYIDVEITNSSGSARTFFYLSYTAFKLYTDTEYNGLLNNQRYSTSEIDTGKTWIDGKPIYRKVVEVASFTSGTQAIPHGITNLDKMVNIYGVAKSGTTQLTIPYDYRTDGIDQNTNIYISGANVNIRQNWDASSYSGYIIFEYTKTS